MIKDSKTEKEGLSMDNGHKRLRTVGTIACTKASSKTTTVELW